MVGIKLSYISTISTLYLNLCVFVFRRKLYAELFEYDMPLMHPEPKVFSFLDSNNSEYENPWKESLRQLVSIFCLSVIGKRTNTK